MCELKELENGFEYIEVINDAACAEIALQGAHIFHFARTAQEPILWLSDESAFKYGKAIRGGVPICWPSFGMNNTKLPQHGFARTSLFKFVSCETMKLYSYQQWVFRELCAFISCPLMKDDVSMSCGHIPSSYCLSLYCNKDTFFSFFFFVCYSFPLI